MATKRVPSSEKQAREWEKDDKKAEDISKLVGLAEAYLREIQAISKELRAGRTRQDEHTAAVKAMTEPINGLAGRLSDR